MPKLTFGGGRNLQARVVDIDPSECTDGENFDLSLADSGWNRRKSFSLVGTATNAAEIRGFAQLVSEDGTISTLIQAGNTVYSWDGTTNFTSVGTVNSSSRLRGHWRTQNFELDGYVIITDLEKLSPVKKWTGSSFVDLDHNLVGEFRAKYCFIDNERALFGNCFNIVDLKHLIVGSKRGDPENLSVSDRPSTALSQEDPFFIPMQDFRGINGLTDGFGIIIISTEHGRLWKLSGTSSKDFAIDNLFTGSAAAGPEAITNVGNDVIFGRVGVIESLSGVDRFGDVEADDLSLWIKPEAENVKNWRIVYDPRTQRILCFPDGESFVHVLHKSLLATELSPWSKWTTTHALAFQPTLIFQIKNPVTGLDAVFMGNGSGNIYLIDGADDQDGGTDDITSFRISTLFRGQTVSGAVFDIKGMVEYPKNENTHTLDITFLHSGEEVFDKSLSLTLPAEDGSIFYGGSFHYGDGTPYGFKFKDRLYRQTFDDGGLGNELQIKTSITGSTNFRIDEISFTGEEEDQEP